MVKREVGRNCLSLLCRKQDVGAGAGTSGLQELGYTRTTFRIKVCHHIISWCDCESNYLFIGRNIEF
jgi:hypothetical protein